MATTTTLDRDHNAVMLGRDDFEAVAVTLSASPTVQAAWDEVIAHRTGVGFPMPEWRRRRLAESRGRIVAYMDTTGSVAL
jgi:hypothetical protein